MLKRVLIPLLVLLLCISAASADELYTPDDFTFTGGTGRVTISCPEIRRTLYADTIDNGQLMSSRNDLYNKYVSARLYN